MLVVTLALGLGGLFLLLAAPMLARLVMGKGRDNVALVRILQLIGIVLMLGALLTRPYDRDTRAIPPPPDAPER